MIYAAPVSASKAPAVRQWATMTLQRPFGPLVLDVWEPRAPAKAAKDAAPVLLIHGWGGTGSYWRETARYLSETVQVIVPDLPGTGRSQPVNWPQNMFNQVDTLAHILDVLGLERVQVVGHSMGGAMAVLLADARPQQVERLVLTSLCFFMSEAQETMYKAAMGLFKLAMNFRPGWLAQLPLVPQLVATRYFYRVPKDNELLRQGLRDYLELDGATAAACADDAPNPVITQAGARIRVPTLLIACRQDQVMPVQNVDFTLKTIPNSQVRWMDRCGHMPMVEKPQEYFALLHEFLRL